jgi:hypothetical protein
MTQGVKIFGLILGLLYGITSNSHAAEGEPDALEAGLAGRTDILVYGGFETDIPGTGDWRTIWASPWMNPNRSDQLSTVHGDKAIAGGKALYVSYPKGGVGPNETGTQWPSRLADYGTLASTYDSLYLRYYVYFEPGFDFNRGGKLPGLMGGGNSWSRSGGDQPDGTNGWTMRFMWRSNGEAVVYAYLPDGKYKEGIWGTDIKLNVHFETGKWICIEQFIKVNTIGTPDGKLQVWIDNTLVLDLDDVLYRTVENDAGRVGGFYFSTFHGGSDISWAPSLDSYARFDAIVLALQRVGPIAEPSTSTNAIAPTHSATFTKVGNALEFISSATIHKATAIGLNGSLTPLPSQGNVLFLEALPKGLYHLVLQYNTTQELIRVVR